MLHRRAGVRTMSLTSFVAIADVRAKLKPLRPKPPRKLSAPLKVEPRTTNYAVVGSAFDYLLRFELQRRAPHAISQPWVAEHAPKIIDRQMEVDPEQYNEQVADRVRVLLGSARAALAAYLKMTDPTAAKQAELAAFAIRLAKLDLLYRRRLLEPSFEEASSEDVRDLVDLLAIVPFDDLLHDEVLLLNPTFGETSRLVGGADTDLIAADLLADFKTTKMGAMEGRSLDQILGYLLLARKQRSVDPMFPVINRLGLYYSRHGYLWSMEASTWTSHPDFPEIEQWFFQRADEVLEALTGGGALGGNPLAP